MAKSTRTRRVNHLGHLQREFLDWLSRNDLLSGNDLVRDLGHPYNATMRSLNRLEEAGLVTHVLWRPPAQKGQRSRKLWRVTQAGRAELQLRLDAKRPVDVPVYRSCQRKTILAVPFR